MDELKYIAAHIESASLMPLDGPFFSAEASTAAVAFKSNIERVRQIHLLVIDACKSAVGWTLGNVREHLETNQNTLPRTPEVLRSIQERARDIGSRIRLEHIK